jgi:predicted PurR-regulated permease PerM
VIIAILLGTELAGILGALLAMPVAGAIQVTIAELLRQRDYRRRAAALPRDDRPFATSYDSGSPPKG